MSIQLENYELKVSEDGSVLLRFDKRNELDILENITDCNFSLEKGILKIKYLNNNVLLNEINILNLSKESLLSLMKQDCLTIQEISEKPFHYTIKKK